MDNKINTKKAQLSVFIIAALIIVVIVAMIFILVNRPSSALKPTENPQAYIQDCVQDSLKKIETSVLENNFYPNQSKNFMIYFPVHGYAGGIGLGDNANRMSQWLLRLILS